MQHWVWEEGQEQGASSSIYFPSSSSSSPLGVVVWPQLPFLSDETSGLPHPSDVAAFLSHVAAVRAAAEVYRERAQEQALVVVVLDKEEGPDLSLRADQWRVLLPAVLRQLQQQAAGGGGATPWQVREGGAAARRPESGGWLAGCGDVMGAWLAG